MTRPNVLLLMSDEHNNRFLGHREGGEPVRTPTFDELLEASVDFEETYCPVPLCAPSRKCMLTGKEAQRAEAWSNETVTEGHHQTLPEQFGDQGYETCLVGKMHFQGTRQFNGFQYRPYGDLTGHGIQQPSHQPDPINPEALDVQSRRQAIEFGTRIPSAGVTEIPESMLQEWVVARETITWLREQEAQSSEPWFLTASFSRPHFPLTAPRRHFERYWPDNVPEPPVSRKGDTVDHPLTRAKIASEMTDEFDEETLRRARAAYFACVDFLDEVLGELLETLELGGFLEDTIVVYVSDHGDLAGEHGLWWKNSWHEGSVRVPMAIQLPEHRRGEASAEQISTPVSLLDLYPTLCELAGFDPSEGVDGHSLAEAVSSGTEPERDPVFCDHFGPPYGDDALTYRLVRDGRYKYVGFRDAPELLFDLAQDPFEQRNLAADPGEEHQEVLKRLRETVSETIDFAEIEQKRAAYVESFEEYELPIPPGTGNAYLLPDGRLVDAATPLYKPDVLADDPSGVFEDWPDKE